MLLCNHQIWKGSIAAMIKFAICDDDKEFSDAFRIELLEEFNKRYTDEETKVVYYQTAQECLSRINEDSIDVYFIDIEYGEVLGHDVARVLDKTRPNIGIVYITNHEYYVYSSFVCRPLGFIRKKSSAHDLKMTLDSVSEYLKKQNKVFTFRDGRKEININGNEIVSLGVSDHYLEIEMLEKSIVLRDKLERLEKELCNNGFVRISRSCIVNMKYIESINDTDVNMSNGSVLHSSEKKKSQVYYSWRLYQMKY